jgi:hypothetical protein
VDGPHIAGEPPITGERHPVLAGFDETDILPFGGTLEPLKVSSNTTVPLTFIPPFPIYPPETSWMRQPRTDIPGLVLNSFGRGRVAFLPADIDRRFAIDNLPDHGDLLLIPVCPLRVKVRVPNEIEVKTVRMRVAQDTRPAGVKDGWVEFELNSLLDHELVVLQS